MGESQEVKLMRERAEAVQSVVAAVKDFEEALQYVVDLTRRQGGSTIAAPGLAENEQAILGSLCEKSAIELLTGELRSHVGRIHAGFTRADWGIAETATLVIDSSSEETRIATMLSETHVALLPASRIKADMMALERELSSLLSEAPRYLSFISGASRTADIERVLTIGVHGPQELHILILEENRQ